MTAREQRVLAGLVLTTLTLAALLFLLACQHRGFDDSMCRAYQQCGWRDA